MSSGAPTPAAAGSDDAVAAFATASAFAAAAMAALPRGLEGKRAAGSSCAAASLALSAALLRRAARPAPLLPSCAP